MELYFIRIGSTGKISWISYDDSQEKYSPVNTLSKKELDDLFDKILQQQSQVIILLPGEDISITQLDLPQHLSEAQLYQATRYALDGKLYSNIDEIKFAIGQRQGNKVTVAIIDKQKINQLCERFAPILPNIIQCIPESIALPYQDHQWSILIDKSQSIVRFSKTLGFSIENENLEQLLQLTFNEIAEKPKKITVRHHPDTEIAKIVFPKKIHSIHDENDPLTVMAKAQSTFPTINLLKEESSFNFDKISKKRLRIAAALLALFVIIYFTSQATKLIFLNKQINKVEARIGTLYYTVYPNAKTIVAPKTRIKEDIKRARENSGDSDFITMVDALGEIKSSHPTFNITALSYRNNAISLAANVKSLKEFEAIKNEITPFGLVMSQEKALIGKNNVKINLTIKKEE